MEGRGNAKETQGRKKGTKNLVGNSAGRFYVGSGAKPREQQEQPERPPVLNPATSMSKKERNFASSKRPKTVAHDIEGVDLIP